MNVGANLSLYHDVKSRNASAWLLPKAPGFPRHLRDNMRRFDDSDDVDVVIVGCGAGGGTLAQRLARAGWRVVALDAGPFWDPESDWVSDERGSHSLYWTEPRLISGANPVPLGSNNSGRTLPWESSIAAFTSTNLQRGVLAQSAAISSLARFIVG